MVKRVRTQKQWVQAFWSRIEVSDQNSCWPWLGATESGYGIVGVYLDGQWKRERAHRLAYWLKHKKTLNVPKGMLVRHLCHRRICCNPQHLERGSSYDNIHDTIEIGAHAHGERHGHSKLTSDDVVSIRRAAAQGVRYKAIASPLGVTTATVADVVTRRTWKHVP